MVVFGFQLKVIFPINGLRIEKIQQVTVMLDELHEMSHFTNGFSLKCYLAMYADTFLMKYEETITF